jgi:hypothetical protein
MTIMPFDATVRMCRGFEECVMWAVRILKILVSGYLGSAIGILNLLDDVLSPRERFEDLNSLQPLVLFQIESRLNAFAWIGGMFSSRKPCGVFRRGRLDIIVGRGQSPRLFFASTEMPP